MTMLTSRHSSVPMRGPVLSHCLMPPECFGIYIGPTKAPKLGELLKTVQNLVFGCINAFVVITVFTIVCLQEHRPSSCHTLFAHFRKAIMATFVSGVG